MLYFWIYELAVTTPEEGGGGYTYVLFLHPSGWPSAKIQECKIIKKFQIFEALPGVVGGIVSDAEKCEEKEHHRVPHRLHRGHSTSADSGEQPGADLLPSTGSQRNESP